MKSAIFTICLFSAGVVFVGCGDDAPPPPPVSDAGTTDAGGCNGCLDSTGGCVGGNDNAACGAGGGMCTACDTASGEACVDNACSAAPVCNPDNCDGCCQGDLCLSGGADDACGATGFECQDCASTDGTCQAGSCTSECSPETCLTCCDASGSCIDGATDAVCGRFGDACGACGTEETCVPSVYDFDDTPIGGSCVDTSCSSTCGGCCNGTSCEGGDTDAACGSMGEMCTICAEGLTCTDGDCTPDPTSRWDILILQGIVPVTDPLSEPWDSFGGLPDPYVEVTVRDPDTGMLTEQSSEVEDNTVTPVWNEAVLTAVPARDIVEMFRLTVYEDDLVDDPIIGFCDPVSPVLFTGMPITVECRTATVGEGVFISFRLRLN